MSVMQPPPAKRIPAPARLTPRVHPSWAEPRHAATAPIDASALRKLWEAVDGE